MSRILRKPVAPERGRSPSAARGKELRHHVFESIPVDLAAADGDRPRSALVATSLRWGI